jgi:hypothetical protein
MPPGVLSAKGASGGHSFERARIGSTVMAKSRRGSPDFEHEFALSQLLERTGGRGGGVSLFAEIIGIDCQRSTVGVLVSCL